MRSFMQFHREGWHEHSVGGCTPSEIKVLFCVAKGMRQNNGVITVSEISKLLNVTSPTVTQILKKLETNGFVERRADETDRRVVRITPTEKGMGIARQAREELHASLNELVDYIGEEQSKQLADLLSKVSRFFSEKAASEHYIDWNGEQTL